jgi:hypothetical protein
MPSSIVSLLAANAVGVVLMLAQLLDYEWTKNSKFVMTGLAFVPTVIAIYNISVYPHEDRRVMSFGLSALSLAFLSVVGTLTLH